MGKSEKAHAKAKAIGFEVLCPCCSAMLRVDPVMQLVISHTPPPEKKTFADMDDAARAMHEREQRRDDVFAQSVAAQKNAADLMDKKFAEAMRKAKESPDTGRPLRGFDFE